MSDELQTRRIILATRLDQLCDWLRFAEKANDNEGYDAWRILGELGEWAKLSNESLTEYNNEDCFCENDDEIRQVQRCLNEIAALGIEPGRQQYQISVYDLVKLVPSSIREQLQGVTKKIRDDREARIERRRIDDEVDDAIKRGVFLEHVKRNIGKGASVTFHRNHDYKYSESLYQYHDRIVKPPRPRPWRWVLLKSSEDSFGPIEIGKDLIEIDDAEAASWLLANDCPVSPSMLEWASKLRNEHSKPTPVEPARIGNAARICWNGERGELVVDGVLVKTVHKRAKNVREILNDFERLGWPDSIDSPFPGNEAGKERLRETVRSLNQRLDPAKIRFDSDGAGEGVKVRLAQPPTPTVSIDEIPF